MREGIILGAVVGPGFAAPENAGYAFNALFTVEGLSLRGLVETEVLRGVLTPVGHGVWTAILGGVLFRRPRPGAGSMSTARWSAGTDPRADPGVHPDQLRAAGPHLAQTTLLALVLVFGVYAIVDRVAALVAAARGGSWPAAAAAGWSWRACSASPPASSRSSGPASPPWPCCG
jgi:RsiW-degrading membrane proteinase PrsW (M82 family)